MNIVPISFEVCWCAWNEPAGEDNSQHSLTNCFLSDYQSNVEELSKTGRTLEGEADFRDHGTASECRASRSASLGVVWKYQASSENDLGFSLYWELQVICPYLPYLFVWLFLFYINWFDKYAEGPTCHKISIRVADMMFQVILCGNIYIYIYSKKKRHSLYIHFHAQMMQAPIIYVMEVECWRVLFPKPQNPSRCPSKVLLFCIFCPAKIRAVLACFVLFS